MRVRWLTSLLLGAGIFGCSSAPTRDAAVASYKDDADGVHYHAIAYEEPTGPTSPAQAGGAPRAHLHIPAEYIPYLNWDPETFVDDTAADAVEMEREEEGAASTRRASRTRAYERRWYGNRRARRPARRKFRSTGVSATVSRGGGHAIGLPGQAVGVPGQAVGIPTQAAGRPGQAVGIPGQAAGLPGQAVRLPGPSVGLPGQAVGLPGQAVNLPGQAVSLPKHPVGLPGQAVRVPGHPTRSVPQRSKPGRKKSKGR